MNKDRISILIIDDSITNIVLLNAILSEKGYDIKTVISVVDAFKILHEFTPDLILLDLHMPVLSGFDFLERIKKDEANKEIPIIVVTAYSDKESLNRSLNLGAYDYIEKPINVELLLNKISKFLKYACN